MISPCIKVCRLEEGICTGCGRTQDQIRDWLILTDKERKKIMKKLKKSKLTVAFNRNIGDD